MPSPAARLPVSAGSRTSDVTGSGVMISSTIAMGVSVVPSTASGVGSVGGSVVPAVMSVE